MHFSASSFFKTAYVFYEQYIFAYFVEVERIFFALSACKKICCFTFAFWESMIYFLTDKLYPKSS